MNHDTFLKLACTQAEISQQAGGIASGALLVKAGEIVAQSHNKTCQLNDPIAVAAVDCIRTAGRRSDQAELSLYTTDYPDMLCAGTMLQFSIGAIVIGLPETDTAAIRLLQQKGVPVTFNPYPACQELHNS
ncbi:MAG: creatinine deaminase [Parasphingorhabdus sp.]|jgi:creatinine deaminase